MTMRWPLVMIAVFAAACAAPVTAQRNGGSAGRSNDEQSFDKTLKVSGPVDLDVSTGSGTIDIETHGSNQVEVHGRIHADDNWLRSDGRIEDEIREIESHPPIEQNGNSIRIGHLPDNIHNISISYSIVVPAQTSVRAHTGSGGESISGISGRLEVSTGSGQITLKDIKGDVNSTTGSGGITASVHGGLHAQTGSGTITADGEQTADWELQTGSGGIEVRLPQNAGFQLSAHTGSGGVTIDRPMTVQGRIDGPNRDVAGKVGNGGYELDLRTGSGHIHIE